MQISKELVLVGGIVVGAVATYSYLNRGMAFAFAFAGEEVDDDDPSPRRTRTRTRTPSGNTMTISCRNGVCTQSGQFTQTSTPSTYIDPDTGQVMPSTRTSFHFGASRQEIEAAKASQQGCSPATRARLQKYTQDMNAACANPVTRRDRSLCETRRDRVEVLTKQCFGIRGMTPARIAQLEAMRMKTINMIELRRQQRRLAEHQRRMTESGYDPFWQGVTGKEELALAI